MYQNQAVLMVSNQGSLPHFLVYKICIFLCLHSRFFGTHWGEIFSWLAFEFLSTCDFTKKNCGKVLVSNVKFLRKKIVKSRVDRKFKCDFKKDFTSMFGCNDHLKLMRSCIWHKFHLDFWMFVYVCTYNIFAFK